MFGRFRLWLIIAALIAAVVLTGGQVVRARVLLRQARKQLSKSGRMRDAAARTPTDADSVAKRMRDGKF